MQVRPCIWGVELLSFWGGDKYQIFSFFNLSQADPAIIIVGGWNAYYQDASAASARLNKTVTHAVIFFQQNGDKGFSPVNVIEMVKPENVPTNKVHNTFTNKLQ